MGSWKDFKKKYKLDFDDLPNQASANIVVIEKIELEEFDAAIPNTRPVQYEKQTRTVLWLVGWDVPLRLNNRRIDAICEAYGENPADAIGKKIVLLAQKVEKFGKLEWDIVVHPHTPDPATPATPIPARLATKDVNRLRLAMSSGVVLAALPAGPGINGAASGGAFVPANRGLGVDAAVKLIGLLEERQWSWDKLVKALSDRGLGKWCANLLPPDCDEAIRAHAWAIIGHLPKTKAVDFVKLRETLVASWAPPPAEVINPDTGEVVKNEAAAPPASKFDPMNPDDIPF